MKRIYMNHLIKEKGTKEPVIAVEEDFALSKGVIYANKVVIKGPSQVVRGRYLGRAGHDVKVWIETEAKVEVS